MTGGAYILSSKSLPYRVIKSYGRQMRPLEANMIYDIPGSDFYLYCTSEKDAAPKTGNEAHELLYEYRGISVSRMISMIKYRIREKFNGN